MDQTNELLTRQLTEEIAKLSTMEDGSEEKTATINGISQMYKLKIEEERMKSEFKAQDLEREENRLDRIITHVLDGAKLVLPLGVYLIYLRKGFKFEETGTFTSQTFRNLIGKIKPGR